VKYPTVYTASKQTFVARKGGASRRLFWLFL